MNNGTIYLIKKELKEYPNKQFLFRPSRSYPEYPFKQYISKERNQVYEMVRECLMMMELDIPHLGSEEWNPLGDFISPGDTVLLKPNMVLHYNPSGCGTDCLYTNPSIVAAIVDYVWIALKGRGKIVIGDAPLQECDFEVLCNESGYNELVEFYRQRGIEIELLDFRNIKTYEASGLHYLQTEKKWDGIIVKLNEKSAFAELSPDRIKKLRITNYDPKILQKHHYGHVHEYNIAKPVLDADVIINIPKPKTHRKAGVTISLKNLVGINANKEFLPHHTLGSKNEGGDAYLFSNDLLRMANQVLDIKNELIHDNKMEIATLANKLYTKLLEEGCSATNEQYWEGSWYGNDTIWRTILDLNRILLYADKNGNLTDKKQRKIFIVGDMIVSGQKEGPLEPSPIYPGIIAMGDNPLNFDRAICSIMGFNYCDVPSLSSKMESNVLSIWNNQSIEIISNFELWNKKNIDIIVENSLEFQPTEGWKEKLKNRYREKIYKQLRESKTSVYIFGAGINGIYAKKELIKNGINVIAFCDNNTDLWGKEIIDGIKCISLNNTDKCIKYVVAVKEKYTKEITEQIINYGGEVVGIINKN